MLDIAHGAKLTKTVIIIETKDCNPCTFWCPEESEIVVSL